MNKRYWIEHPFKEGNYWVVKYGLGDGEERHTQGTSEYNAFEMAADAICACLDIKQECGCDMCTKTKLNHYET